MCQTAVTATETPTFCPKDRRFFSCGLRVEKKKKRKKNYRDLARKNSSTSWIVKLIESAVHEWFFHVDGSILFHPCKIWTIKKVECLYTSVLSLFMNPVVCSFWSIGRKLETDIDASFIADIFFSSMHKMTILDSINIKIEEKLSRIWAYSIEILHHKFYNRFFISLLTIVQI